MPQETWECKYLNEICNSISFNYITGRGTTGSSYTSIVYYKAIFIFNIYIYYSTKQSAKFPFSPHTYQYLSFYYYFIVIVFIAILTGVRWNFIEVLICISLMNSDIKHLFMYLLAIFYLLRKNVYSSSLSIFCLSCWDIFTIKLYNFLVYLG